MIKRVLAIVGALFLLWLWQNPQNWRYIVSFLGGLRQDLNQKVAIAQDSVVSPTPQGSRPIEIIELQPIRVSFNAGASSTVLSGQLSRNVMQPYWLDSQAGQTMTVMPQGGNVRLTLVAPSGSILAQHVPTINERLPESGDYQLKVRSLSGQYSIKVEIY